MTAPVRSFRDTAAVFASVVALVLAAAYFACRVGYQGASVRPVLLSLGLSWLLIHFAFGLRCLSPRVRESTSWLAGDGFLTLAGLLGVLGAALLVGKVAGLPLAAAGGALGLARIVGWLRGEGWGRASAAVFFACLLGASLAGRAWGENYLDPLLECKIARGEGNTDQLYHCGISNMYRTYGVASTGLDGTVYHYYHTGSHFLLAQLGVLLHQTGIEVYKLTFPVVFLPLLFFGALAAGAALTRTETPPSFGLSLVIWLALLSMSARVLPGMLWLPSGVWESSLISESMCIAEVILLLGLAAAAPMVCRPEEVVRPGFPLAALIAAVAFPAFIGVLGFLKLSVGAVVLPACGVLYLASGALRRNAPAGVGMVAGCVAFVVVYRLTSSPHFSDEMASFALLHFVRSYVPLEWWGYYLPCQLLFLLLAITLRLRRERVGTLAELCGALRTGGLRELWFVVVVAAVGAVPGMIWPIATGSAVYFSEVQRWPALAVLLAALLATQSEAVALSWRERLSRLPLWQPAVGFLLLSVFATMGVNTYAQCRALVCINFANRGFAPSPGDGPRERLSRALSRGNMRSAYRLLRSQARVVQAHSDPRTRTLEALGELYWMPPEKKRQTMLFIPKTNRVYWDMLGSRPVWSAPMVGPAVSGLALIDGLPERKDFTTRWYGYANYPVPEEKARQNAEEAREAVCRKAAQMGVRWVIVLDASADGQPVLSEWRIDSPGGTDRSLATSSGPTE